ncbi:uncharacterized protein GIQ15_02443 [Arthroderma uncinatum]|uniref:uncharacterized protein n=1 Tax=Arthroderma uncinatum TaxID=74035 RepID=UPI00144AE8B7|nr:uncharacterized protein GIQ15_02443 [Arthroderma uncinatum]KAF3483119.1 hypothetical protein GIQ15_02443 [Arthroderma uncinatum]
MALWPFGRHKKRARKGDDETYATPVDQPQQLAPTAARPHTPPSQTTNAAAAGPNGGHAFSAGKLVRRDSKRQKYNQQQTQGRNASSIFHRSSPAAATTSTAAGPPSSAFSSPQVDSPMTLPDGRTLRQPASVDTFASVNALSPSKLRSAPKMMLSQPGDNEAYLVPTLHGKRNSTEPSILRRRSDRRRRNDHEREQEIRRMTSQVWEPKRNQKDAGKASDRHLSDPFTSYSSPLVPEPAESYTFKLGALNALSPRPFLRYGDGNRGSLPATAEISRSSTTKDKGKSRWFSADHSATTNNSNKRIEDLADSMDAGALRQLMDRDRRRRLVKRQIIREQQQAAVARQRPASIEVKAPVEKEQQSMGSPVRLPSPFSSSPPPPEHMEISKSPEPSGSWLRDASKESLVRDHIEPITEIKENLPPAATSPVVVSRNGQTLELALAPGEERDEIPDIRQHPAFRQPSISEASTKPSTQNETKLGRTWTQIFRRRGTLRHKPSVSPKNNSSEFSVTSRDSRSRINQQYHPAPVATSIQRAGTDTQSIQSKFTEHLDDGSNIPQGTRMYPAESSSNINRDDAYSVSHRMSGISTGAYVPGPDTRPNSTFLAQSLASIDSEGSWLSGRPSRRLSQAPLKSPGSTRERLDDMNEPDGEDDYNAVSSDEYFGTLPAPKEEEEDAGEFNLVGNKDAKSNAVITANGHREPIAAAADDTTPLVEDGMELANADGDPPTWHSSVGKRARLISPETRAKSREGLFTEFIDSENEVSPIDETEPEIRRAQSIDMGRHIRHISAGSAKIVTLCRAESKRYSTASISSSGVLPSRTEEEEV